MHAIPAVNNDLIRTSKWCSHNSLLIKLLVAGLRQLISELPAISLTVQGKASRKWK